ncbi:MAG: hypothetical protein PHH83_03685 [Patescibacteria group bacterium]|nr:hypothetical protein [Patescibacteria group bacterium]
MIKGEIVVSLDQILKTIEVCSLEGFMSLSYIIKITQIESKNCNAIIEAWNSKYKSLKQLEQFGNLNCLQREELISCYERVLEFLEIKKKDSA